MELIAGIILGIRAIEDMRKKTVCVGVPVLGCVLAVIGRISQGTIFSLEPLLGAIIGLVCLMLARISGGQIGIGDGLILLVCGICLGWRRQIVLLLLAMIMFLVVGIVGIGLKLWSGKKPLAFVPYLSASFFLQLLLGRNVCIP